MEIKNRWTNATMHSVDAPTMRAAIEQLVKSEADLSGAHLSEANLSRADLSGADLSGADLSGADLSRADLSGAIGLPAAPTIANIDAAIVEAIDAGGALRMDTWHTCQTTHCRAGWAITLAGDAGAALEAQYGSCAAGALIYNASAGYVPDFYASDDNAMDDLRARAAANND